MTYGTLFQPSTRTADQCSARTVKRAAGFCKSCAATCRGLWDVYATSLSISTSSATTATTGVNPGTEDTFHRQVIPQSHYVTAATRNQSKVVFRRSRSTCDYSPSASRRTVWLNGGCQLQPFSWNTVLIAYSLRNCLKLINCWYQKNHAWLITH